MRGGEHVCGRELACDESVCGGEGGRRGGSIDVWNRVVSYAKRVAGGGGPWEGMKEVQGRES